MHLLSDLMNVALKRTAEDRKERQKLLETLEVIRLLLRKLLQ